MVSTSRPGWTQWIAGLPTEVPGVVRADHEKGLLASSSYCWIQRVQEPGSSLLSLPPSWSASCSGRPFPRTRGEFLDRVPPVDAVTDGRWYGDQWASSPNVHAQRPARGRREELVRDLYHPKVHRPAGSYPIRERVRTANQKETGDGHPSGSGELLKGNGAVGLGCYHAVDRDRVAEAG